MNQLYIHLYPFFFFNEKLDAKSSAESEVERV